MESKRESVIYSKDRKNEDNKRYGFLFTSLLFYLFVFFFVFFFHGLLAQTIFARGLMSLIKPEIK